MMMILGEKYYNPKLMERIEEVTKSCFLCLTEKSPNQSKPKFGKKIFPCVPRAFIQFDIADGFNEVKGYKYVYIWVDSFTLFTILVKAKSKSAEEILNSYRERIVSVWGQKLL